MTRADLLAPALPRLTILEDAPEGLEALLDPDGTVIVPVGGPPDAAARTLAGLGLADLDLIATAEPRDTPGSTTEVPLRPGAHPVRRVLFVGTGSGSTDDLRTAYAAAGRAVRSAPVVTVLLPDSPEDPGSDRDGDDDGDGDARVRAAVDGLLLGGSVAPKWAGEGPVDPGPRPGEVRLLCGPGRAASVRNAVVGVRATLIARALANTPSNVKNPVWMARQARTLARRHGLTCTVWTEKDLARDGFGGLLAVGRGSASPPRLVQLEHRPRGVDAPHVVLVGKGITFDTGGINLKPADAMAAMKTDMTGSAIVLAVLGACAELDLPVRVTGLLALAENAIGGAATRPSDVITQYGGRRVEIGNTDAEGRIVLADALAYADARLDPDVMVDIATLTGAARVAFGRAMAPVLSADDALVEHLSAAGRTVGETLWRLPLHGAYRRHLDSPVADLNHISADGGAGSIMAGLFLADFVGQRRWAHLDIAGPGRSDADTGILAKGGTGFGARLLLRWLEDLA